MLGSLLRKFPLRDPLKNGSGCKPKTDAGNRRVLTAGRKVVQKIWYGEGDPSGIDGKDPERAWRKEGKVAFLRKNVLPLPKKKVGGPWGRQVKEQQKRLGLRECPRKLGKTGENQTGRGPGPITKRE